MPTNSAILSQLQNEAIYGKESLARIIPLLKDSVGAGFAAGTDDLKIFHGTVTALAAGGEIVTNAGVRVFAVHVDSPAASTTDVVVRMFNTSTASTALTTTAYGTSKEVISIPCLQTKSKTAVFLPDGLEFSAAASYAVVSASALDTAAAVGAAPTVTVLYR
jgi:hypothetical protein